MNTLIIGKTKNIKLSKIIPYKNNIPRHTQEDIINLKEWFESVGYRSRIGIDKSNVIVYGHKRYYALKLINPNMTIPVDDLSDLDDIKIKKLRIADNTKRTTDFDDDKLQKELKSIYEHLEDSAALINQELNIDIDDLFKEINNGLGDNEKLRSASDKLVKIILEYTTKDKTKFDIFARDIMDEKLITSVSDLILFLMEQYTKTRGN